jgi:hypothetical protein
VRFNPQMHGIFLEGGLDRQGRFVRLPSLDLPRLAQYVSPGAREARPGFLERAAANKG